MSSTAIVYLTAESDRESKFTYGNGEVLAFPPWLEKRYAHDSCDGRDHLQVRLDA